MMHTRGCEHTLPVQSLPSAVGFGRKFAIPGQLRPRIGRNLPTLGEIPNLAKVCPILGDVGPHLAEIGLLPGEPKSNSADPQPMGNVPPHALPELPEGLFRNMECTRDCRPTPSNELNHMSWLLSLGRHPAVQCNPETVAACTHMFQMSRARHRVTRAVTHTHDAVRNQRLHGTPRPLVGLRAKPRPEARSLATAKETRASIARPRSPAPLARAIGALVGGSGFSGWACGALQRASIKGRLLLRVEVDLPKLDT